MRPVEVARWVHRELGGFGLFFNCVIGLPFSGFLIAVDPTNPKRWVGGALLLAFSLAMSRSKQREERAREEIRAAQERARDFIRRQRELPVPHRHVRDLDLDLLESGLREPPR